MLTSFGSWLRRLLRTPQGVVLAAVVSILVGFGLWRSLRSIQFARHLSAGEQAQEAFDFPQARHHFEACLAIRPSDPELLLRAAQVSRRDGQLDEAAALLERYRSAVGVSSPAGQLEAVLLEVQRGNVKQYVHQLIEEVEIRHPASEQILESLALGCVHVYRLDEASFWTRQLNDRFPENPLGRLLDAQTQDTLRHRDEAQKIARQLVDDFPHYDKARLYLAGLLFKTNQYEESIPHYQQLRLRQPEALEPLLNLASALSKLERMEEARPLFEELQVKHGDNSQALLECARFAMQQGSPAKAEPLLKRAVQLAPFDHEIHLELATCLEHLGQTDESRRHLAKFQQIEADMKLLDAAFKTTISAPSDPEPRLEAGRICLRNGQVTEGIRWLYGVLDLVPDHRTAHQILADFYQQSGDLALAQHHRTEAEKQPQLP